MSGDLSPTALAELEIGSGQDHNARHTEQLQRTREQYEPLVSWPAFVVLLMAAISLAAALIVWWAFPAPTTPFLPHLEHKQ